MPSISRPSVDSLDLLEHADLAGGSSSNVPAVQVSMRKIALCGLTSKSSLMAAK